jgi:hypothetical protein
MIGTNHQAHQPRKKYEASERNASRQEGRRRSHQTSSTTGVKAKRKTKLLKSNESS